jgi:hypothetical protein
MKPPTFLGVHDLRSTLYNRHPDNIVYYGILEQTRLSEVL